MKVLLLNSTYQPIAFVSQRKAFKMYVKGKVEVLSSWAQKMFWGSGCMDIPSVIRMKYYVRWIPRRAKFNRTAVFRRDKYHCQYCGKHFKVSDLTIDHIIPSSKGGKTDWHNCTTACFACNNKKGDRTPDEAYMEMLSKPIIPIINISNDLYGLSPHHNDWKVYLGL